MRNEARARLMIRLLLVPAALIALMLVAPAVTSAGLDLITCQSQGCLGNDYCPEETTDCSGGSACQCTCYNGIEDLGRLNCIPPS